MKVGYPTYRAGTLRPTTRPAGSVCSILVTKRGSPIHHCNPVIELAWADQSHLPVKVAIRKQRLRAPNSWLLGKFLLRVVNDNILGISKRMKYEGPGQKYGDYRASQGHYAIVSILLTGSFVSRLLIDGKAETLPAVLLVSLSVVLKCRAQKDGSMEN
jgi:hypothetical protein